MTTAGNTLQTDMISVAAVSFSAGLFLIVAMAYFLAGDLLGSVFAAAGIVGVGSAFMIGRRALQNVR